MTEQASSPETEKKAQGQFALQRIYVKDISFEAPGAPQVFTLEWKPESKVQVNTSARRLSENQYEVVLMLNVTVSLGEKVAFIAEVKQAGIFIIDAPESMLDALLGAQCPTIIYPYARETVSDLVSRGTFPQLLLQPMNFEAIFAEAKRRRDEQRAAPAGDAAATH